MELAGFTTIDEVGEDENVEKEEEKLYESQPLAQNLINQIRGTPLVGLQYVLEVRKDGKEAVENCSYICSLCSKKMSSSTLVAHVKSVPHRLKYSEFFSQKLHDKYGKLEVKQWTATLVKEFTLALQDVEKEYGRERMAVSSEKAMASALQILKDKAKSMAYNGKGNENGTAAVKPNSGGPVAKKPASGPATAKVPEQIDLTGSSPSQGLHEKQQPQPYKKPLLPSPRNMQPKKLPESSSSSGPPRGAKDRDFNRPDHGGSNPAPSSRPPNRGGPDSRGPPGARDNRGTGPDTRGPAGVRDNRGGGPGGPMGRGRGNAPPVKRRSRSPPPMGRSYKSPPRGRSPLRRPRSPLIKTRPNLPKARSPPPRGRSPPRSGSSRGAGYGPGGSRKVDKDHLLAKFRADEQKLRNDCIRIRDRYIKDPDSHPRYKMEWEKFWDKRYREVKQEGQDVNFYDFKGDWIKYFPNRIGELSDQEYLNKRLELLHRHNIPDPDSRPKPLAPPRINYDRGPDKSSEHKSSKDDSSFSKKRPVSPRNSYSDGRKNDYPSSKRGRRSHSPHGGERSNMRMSSHNRLAPSAEKYEIGFSVNNTLRLLSELEDQLGSLSAAIKSMLQKCTELSSRGKNPLSVFDDGDNTVVLKLAHTKLQSLTMSGVLNPMMVARTQKAIEATVWLMNEIENSKPVSLTSKITKLGVDLNHISMATIGKTTVEIAQFIAQYLLNIGKGDADESVLQEILFAVAENHKKIKAAAQSASIQNVSSNYLGMERKGGYNNNSGGGVAKTIADNLSVGFGMSSYDQHSSVLFPSGNAPMAQQCSNFGDTSGALGILQNAYDDKDDSNRSQNKPLSCLSLNELQEMLLNFRNLNGEDQRELTDYLKKLEATDSNKVTKLRALMRNPKPPSSNLHEANTGNFNNKPFQGNYESQQSYGQVSADNYDSFNSANNSSQWPNKPPTHQTNKFDDQSGYMDEGKREQQYSFEGNSFDVNAKNQPYGSGFSSNFGNASRNSSQPNSGKPAFQNQKYGTNTSDMNSVDWFANKITDDQFSTGMKTPLLDNPNKNHSSNGGDSVYNQNSAYSNKNPNFSLEYNNSYENTQFKPKNRGSLLPNPETNDDTENNFQNQFGNQESFDANNYEDDQPYSNNDSSFNNNFKSQNSLTGGKEFNMGHESESFSAGKPNNSRGGSFQSRPYRGSRGGNQSGKFPNSKSSSFGTEGYTPRGGPRGRGSGRGSVRGGPFQSSSSGPQYSSAGYEAMNSGRGKFPSASSRGRFPRGRAGWGNRGQ